MQIPVAIAPVQESNQRMETNQKNDAVGDNGDR